MKLLYSERARADVQSVYAYLAQNSENAAINCMRELDATISQLMTFPQLGVKPKYEELRNLGLRVLICGNYLVFYKVVEAEQVVYIVRVLHGTVDYQNKIV